jgi:hypothetical protein
MLLNCLRSRPSFPENSAEQLQKLMIAVPDGSLFQFFAANISAARSSAFESCNALIRWASVTKKTERETA